MSPPYRCDKCRAEIKRPDDRLVLMVVGKVFRNRSSAWCCRKCSADLRAWFKRKSAPDSAGKEKA